MSAKELTDFVRQPDEFYNSAVSMSAGGADTRSSASVEVLLHTGQVRNF